MASATTSLIPSNYLAETTSPTYTSLRDKAVAAYKSLAATVHTATHGEYSKIDGDATHETSSALLKFESGTHTYQGAPLR